MNDPNNSFSFSRMMQPRGLAGTTSAPQNVDEDSPPGAGEYSSGPLANLPPRPTPTPAPQSLSVLANGGENHAQIWMNGGAAPVQQQPFPTSLSEMSDAMQPQPAAPQPDPNAMHKFTWANAFQPQGQTY